MGEREDQRRTVVLSEAGKKRLGFAEGTSALIHTDERLLGSAGPEVRCTDIYGRTWVLAADDIREIRP